MRRLTVRDYVITRVFIYGLVLSILGPMLYIVSSSLTDPAHQAERILLFIPQQATLKNYVSAFEYAAETLNVPVWLMFLNSSIYTGFSILISLVLSTAAAFGFANYSFRGKEILFLLILSTMTIPLQSLLIPLFLLLKRLDLLNTYLALILPYAAIGLPFSTLLLRGFFEALPRELRDAARIDGASDFGYFRQVVLPLSIAPLATCVIFLFLTFWNEFLLALVMIQSDKLAPLTLTLSRIVKARAPQPLPVYAAIILIGAVPILAVFILLQRWFVRGIAAGAIKG
jgi:ABC-type glycerol-3-phosphate transport system permease component